MIIKLVVRLKLTKNFNQQNSIYKHVHILMLSYKCILMPQKTPTAHKTYIVYERPPFYQMIYGLKVNGF